MKSGMKELSVGALLEAGLSETTAREWLELIHRMLESLSAQVCWQTISKENLRPDHPFELHQILYHHIFRNWDTSKAPVPAWSPTPEQISKSNIGRAMGELKIAGFQQFHQWSVQHYSEFWKYMIRRLGIRFKIPYQGIVDLSQGVTKPRWLPQAELNIVDSCFQAAGGPGGRGSAAHLSPAGDGAAIIFQNHQDEIDSISINVLQDLTNRVANGIFQSGFEPGDALSIIMPMSPESVAIYLGIIKAGCLVVSIADSFAPSEIEKRLRLAHGKAIFTQDVVQRAGKQLPLYEKIITESASRAIVLPERDDLAVPLRPGDLSWQDFLSDDANFESVSCSPHAHTNILFSSGTTGDPKAIPWTHTTPIKCAADGYLHQNIQPGDIIAWPTNLGWMMGPWLIYASLLNRSTIALYPDAPTQRGFGQFIQDAQVTMLGVVPSLVKIWKSSKCMQGLDWSAIKVFSSTGECSNTEDMLYLMSLAGYKPIIEYCGGTEIGGAYITGTVVQPSAPTTFTTPAFGLDFVILDENGEEVDNGEVFLNTPSMGLSTELVNKDHHQVYYEGTPKGLENQILRRHGDQIEKLPGGYYRAHGRADDTMNLGGIKVSSAEIERILNQLDGIQETAAIAINANEGPSQLVIYACLLPNNPREKSEWLEKCRKAVKQKLNPLFKIHDVVIVDILPRTASNKIMRRKLRTRYKS